MSIKELNYEQRNMVKQRYYCENNENVSWGELATIDELVSDEEIDKEYADTDFVEDDFGLEEKEYDDVLCSFKRYFMNDMLKLRGLLTDEDRLIELEKELENETITDVLKDKLLYVVDKILNS